MSEIGLSVGRSVGGGGGGGRESTNKKRIERKKEASRVGLCIIIIIMTIRVVDLLWSVVMTEEGRPQGALRHFDIHKVFVRTNQRRVDVILSAQHSLHFLKARYTHSPVVRMSPVSSPFAFGFRVTDRKTASRRRKIEIWVQSYFVGRLRRWMEREAICGHGR